MPTSGEVMNMSGALLNDTGLTIFTYAKQIPYLNVAFREFGQKMELNNIPVTNATSAIIQVDAEATEIADDDLPDGLIDIQQLWQRPTGTNDPFIPITQYEFLPHYWDGTITSWIPAWAWMEQIIKLIPCNQDTDVKLDYIKTAITEITADDDDIEIINAFNYLGYKTAALCARYIGENPERADSLDLQAEIAFSEVLGISTKGKQAIVIRRRPFMMSWKSRGVW